MAVKKTSKKSKVDKEFIDTQKALINKICEDLTEIDESNHVDYIRSFIKSDLNPSHLKVVRNEDGSIRIHVEFAEPKAVVNMVYKDVINREV